MKCSITGLLFCLFVFSSYFAMGMESNNWFINKVSTDFDTICTLCSQQRQEKQYGNEQIKYENTNLSLPCNIYYMNETLAQKTEQDDTPVVSSTRGIWLNPRLFHKYSKKDQKKILYSHAYAVEHHHALKQVLTPMISFYGGLCTWLYSSIRLIRKPPTRRTLGLWALGAVCTNLGKESQSSSLALLLKKYHAKKAKIWSNKFTS